MRVGIEMTPLTYSLTGIGYYARHVIRELSALMPSGMLHGFIAGVRKLDRDNAVIPYRRLPVPPRILNLIWDCSGRFPVDACLDGVDVYHAVNYVLPPLKSARGVLSIHDLGFLREPAWSIPKSLRLFHKNIQRHALRAEAVIACSQATKQDIISLLGMDPNRVHVIYDAADTAFSPVDRDIAKRQVYETLGIKTPYLLFVSTVEARKNVTGLLDAFALADVPHTLVIAGAPGWGMEDVRARVNRLGLSSRVVITGYIRDRSFFPPLYSAAEAFVFPSWHEGFGLAVLEAMSCGCPVIASNAASLPEVGGDAPLYAAPQDTNAWVHAIERVSADDVLRAAMREKGLAQARLFSWRKCAEETLACYERLL